MCVRAAQQSGGVVLPPVYFGFLGPWKPYTFKSLDEDAIDKLYTFIFDSLVHWGFRVLIGITGHNVDPQRAAIARAIESVSIPGKVVGVAGWEVDFAGDPDNCATDHAAKWETSNMMYLYPDRVDMSLLTDADMSPEHRSDADSMIGGIGGLDPREHAGHELGLGEHRAQHAALGGVDGHLWRRRLLLLAASAPGPVPPSSACSTSMSRRGFSLTPPMTILGAFRRSPSRRATRAAVTIAGSTGCTVS